MPVRRIVEGDEAERQFWLIVAGRAGELRVQLLKAQAAHIRSEIAAMLRA